jgi:hypothetical protein
MRRLAVFAGFAALAAVGCSGDISFGELPGRLLDARCIYFERCGLVSSRDHCLAFYNHFAIDNPSPEAAYKAGKLAYDAALARDCIDAWGALSCDATQQPPGALAVCDDVITGTLAQGETCAFDRECVSDNCVAPSCSMACCPGTCGPELARPGVGDACTSLCVDGAFCNASGTCQALLPRGAACSDEVCTYGLYCEGLTPTTTGTCTPFPHLGDACESYCAEVNAVCLGGRCVAVGVLGDTCTSDAQCSGFYTCTTGTCSLMPTRGMPCTRSCSDASWCNGTTCEAQKPNGSTCARSEECLSHWCERTNANGTCTDVPLCF